MAILSEFVSSGAPGNPYTQPAFAIWSNQGGSYGGVNFIDHNYNTIQRYQYSNSGSGDAGMSSTSAPEMFDSYSGSDYTRTNAPAQTNANYTNPQFAGYLGHLSFNCGYYNKGNAGIEMVGSTAYSSYRAVALRDNCVIVNDIDQDYAIWVNGTTFKIGQRNIDQYAFHLSSLTGQYITVTTKNAGYSNTRYGSGCYNAKTNKFCMMESNASYTWKPVIYSNVPGLRYYSGNMYRDVTELTTAQTVGTTGPLYTYFNNAANYTTSYVAASGKPRNSGVEDNYRCITVLCDNDKVVMFQMLPGGNPGAWLHRWAANGTAEGSLRTWSGTTSYGLDQGDRFGVRWVVSSDGRYVMAYCPYYYYGSGQHTVIIRVSDGKFIWDATNDTTYSYYFTPIGKSDFVCMSNVNADGGSGLYVQPINCDHLFASTADNAQANLTRAFITQLISPNYNSTDYPLLIPLQYDTRAFITAT